MTKLWTLAIIVLAALFSRLIPHPPNFTSVTAVSVFAGFYFSNIWLALAIPLVSMVLSDALIGFHSGQMVVYACFAITTWVANALSSKKSFGRIASVLLGSNVFFFLVTNFVEWPGSTIYSQDLSGLFQSYFMALPFYENSVLGDVFYGAIIFGAWELASRGLGISSQETA